MSEVSSCLRKYLVVNGMNKNILSEHTGLSVSKIEFILSDILKVDEKIASKLESGTGIKASHWLGLQKRSK